MKIRLERDGTVFEYTCQRAVLRPSVALQRRGYTRDWPWAWRPCAASLG